MPITRRDASQATGTDKAYLLEAIKLEMQVQQVLDNFANDSFDVIMQNASASGLQNANDVVSRILELLGAALLLFDGHMDTGIGKLAGVKRDAFLEESLPLLRSAGAGDAANLFKNQMGNFVRDMQSTFRTMASGKYELTYNDRMATIDESTQRVIRNLVQSGVRDKLAPQEIAAQLDAYVNPVPGETPVRPWDVIRNATRSTKSFVPSDVLPGSLQTNLMDIARTQSAESFRTFTKRALDDKPWILGYHWVLSASHPHTDICDELAAHGRYDKQESKPDSHNHCLCDFVPEYADRDQVRAMLLKGDL
jgi:hypothetical protein